MHKATVLRAWILFLRRDIAGPFLEQVSSRLRGTCSRFSRPHQLLAPASQGPCFPPNHPRTHPAPGPNKCLSFQAQPPPEAQTEASRCRWCLLQVTARKPAPTSSLTTSPAAPLSGFLQSTPGRQPFSPSRRHQPGPHA